MLFMLREPGVALGAALGLLVGIVLHGMAQAATARGFGDRLPMATRRLSPDPRRHFDPFGVIVMLISAIGWPKPVPLQEPRFRGSRTRYLLTILVGPITNLLLGVLGLVALRLLDVRLIADINPIDYATSTIAQLALGYSFLQEVVYGFLTVNLLVGVLTLVPLPPLDGGRILWLYAPQTPGWRSARYHLEERNFGIGIVLLLSIPLFGGRTGLLFTLVRAVAAAIAAPIALALGFTIGF